MTAAINSTGAGKRGYPRSEERFSRNAETDLVCRLLLEKKILSTMHDPQRRASLRPLLPSVPGIVPVGRLDRDTEGLLLLTNDGALANRLMHPRYGVEREYLAEVEGAPTRRQVAQLLRGVPLDDGPARAASARLVGRAGSRAAVRLVLTEGRKREVKRMLAAAGLPV